MAVVAQPHVEKTPVKKVRHESAFIRVSRYVLVRLLTLFVTVVIGSPDDYDRIGDTGRSCGAKSVNALQDRLLAILHL
jgi:hypothetical protein